MKEGIGPTFKENFSEVDIQKLRGKVENTNTNEPDETKINELTEMLSALFIKTAKKVGIYKEGEGRKRDYSRLNPHQPWFDTDCENMRKLFFHLGKF